MISDDRLRTQAPGIVISCSSSAVFDVLGCAGGHMRNVDDATTTAQHQFACHLALATLLLEADRAVPSG